MTEVPRDITDLRLAPVALELSARIEELGRLPMAELAFAIALESDHPDFTPELRAAGLVRAVSHLVDTRGWDVALDERGIRMTHGRHSLVLGIPESFRAYVSEGAVPVPR